MKGKLPKIASQLNRRLLLIMISMFLLTTFISVVIQYGIAIRNTELFLQAAIDDRIEATYEQLKDLLPIDARICMWSYEEDRSTGLEVLAQRKQKDKIDLLDENGVVIDSTDKSRIGFAVDAEYLASLKENSEAAVFTDEAEREKTGIWAFSGADLTDGGYIQFEYSKETFDEEINHILSASPVNRKILETGFLIVTDKDDKVIGLSFGTNANADNDGIDELRIRGGTDEMRLVSYNGNSYFRMYKIFGTNKIISAITYDEAVKNIGTSILMSVVVGVILFVTLYFSVSLLVTRKVVRPVNKIAETLDAITDGDLDAQVSVCSSKEFDTISSGINATVASMKDHIAREAARIDDELRYARLIQRSALPALTEPYRNNRYFGLFASMDTAKEVGGDFYDFYMINEYTLAFMIADVSGKGIPAAMFMMNGKATLHDSITDADDLGSSITNGNRRICEGNEAGMFITSWIGMLDLRTGETHFVNAGHNPPVLIRDGKAEYLKAGHDLILGAMDDEEYSSHTMKLQKGDILFLYTDGVTEATNEAKELYGEERLLEALSAVTVNGGCPCEDICGIVEKSVGHFVDNAPQADDITMLCLYYKGQD